MASSSSTSRKDPDPSRSGWTSQEDELLKKIVHENGPSNWSVISESFPGRSANSCRLRWHEHLDPGIDHSHFTPTEDAIIAKAQAKRRNKWATIGKKLVGRPDSAIRNRWNSVLKHKFFSNPGTPSVSNVSDSRGSLSHDVCRPDPFRDITPNIKEPDAALSLSLPGFDSGKGSNQGSGSGHMVSKNSLPVVPEEVPQPFNEEQIAALAYMIEQVVRHYMDQHGHQSRK